MKVNLIAGDVWNGFIKENSTAVYSDEYKCHLL